MNAKDIQTILCEGFCSGLTVSQTGDLICVSAPFEVEGGDPVSFYLSPVGDNNYRIEDDGSFIPMLIASGVNLLEGAREQEFARILESSGMILDSNTFELMSKPVASKEIAATALQFINAVLKIDALKSPLRPEGVAAMFEQDVRNKVQEQFGSTATITYDEPITDKLSEFLPDIIVRPSVGKPAAVYLLTNDQRAWEAIALRYKAIHQERLDCAVIAMSDRVGSRLVSKRSVASVSSNLDATLYFYDSQIAAMARIGEEIGLLSGKVH